MIRSIKERLSGREDMKYLQNELDNKELMEEFKKTIELTSSDRVYRKSDNKWLKTDADLADCFLDSCINHIRLDKKYKKIIEELDEEKRKNISIISEGKMCTYGLGLGILVFSDRTTMEIDIGCITYSGVMKSEDDIDEFDKSWLEVSVIKAQLRDGIISDESIVIDVS